MHFLRKIIVISIALLSCCLAFSQQVRVSLLPELGLIRSIREGQKFWAVGPTIGSNFHFSPKEAGYAWFGLYTDGKFTNDLTATAKSPAVIPQNIPFNNHATMRLQHFSIGCKHYLFGTYDTEESAINIYAMGGLGIMFGRVANNQTVNIDSTQYNLPILPGESKFRRLTYDVGLGIEKHMGANIYWCINGKMFIPSTEYPSDYLLINHNAPMVIGLNLGIRILFD